MTYSVFGRTLNLAQSINLVEIDVFLERHIHDWNVGMIIGQMMMAYFFCPWSLS